MAINLTNINQVHFTGCSAISWLPQVPVNMMSSSNGNMFRVTGPLCGQFTGHRWIPRTNARFAELWCFLWSLIMEYIRRLPQRNNVNNVCNPLNVVLIPICSNHKNPFALVFNLPDKISLCTTWCTTKPCFSNMFVIFPCRYFPRGIFKEKSELPGWNW